MAWEKDQETKEARPLAKQKHRGVSSFLEVVKELCNPQKAYGENKNADKSHNHNREQQRRRESCY
jgi:hypothetical protein